MKSQRLKLSIILLSLATAAFAQSPASSGAAKAEQKTDAQKTGATKSEAKPALTEAQKTFAVLKTLAGNWDGVISGVAGDPSAEGKTAHMVLRETSMGNALLHEMKVGERPD